MHVVPVRSCRQGLVHLHYLPSSIWQSIPPPQNFCFIVWWCLVLDLCITGSKFSVIMNNYSRRRLCLLAFDTWNSVWIGAADNAIPIHDSKKSEYVVLLVDVCTEHRSAELASCFITPHIHTCHFSYFHDVRVNMRFYDRGTYFLSWCIYIYTIYIYVILDNNVTCQLIC